MLSFSYVISAYELIPGRPGQTKRIGSPGCGRVTLPYADDYNEIGGEADAVYPGSPGGYTSFRGSAPSRTSYDTFVYVASPVAGATISAYVRIRSGWAEADFILMGFPVTTNTQFRMLSLAGLSSQLLCIVQTNSNTNMLSLTFPKVNEWHTYSCTYDTTSDQLASYLDGSLVGTQTAYAESSATTAQASFGFMSIAPDQGTYMDLQAAYLFAFKKTPAEIEDLHNMMIFDGTPRAFPSCSLSQSCHTLA
jgi:hypothetical protein